MGCMRERLVGGVLAALSIGFAGVHWAWALGWRGGLPPGAAPISARPWFWAYDLLAAILMTAAAVVALVLATGTRSALLRRATLICSVLALARGVPALMLDVVQGTYVGVGFGADLWFCVVGLLGLALAPVRLPSIVGPPRTR